MTDTSINAVKRAAKIFGGQSALAAALGISKAAVSQWVVTKSGSHARDVPPIQCVKIERITCGQVKRQELRPADWINYWPELAGSHSGYPQQHGPDAL